MFEKEKSGLKMKLRTIAGKLEKKRVLDKNIVIIPDDETVHRIFTEAMEYLFRESLPKANKIVATERVKWLDFKDKDKVVYLTTEGEGEPFIYHDVPWKREYEKLYLSDELENEKVIVVDDVAYKGDTLERIIDALQKKNNTVVDAGVCILRYSKFLIRRKIHNLYGIRLKVALEMNLFNDNLDIKNYLVETAPDR